jgi:hypothetical protein
MYQTRCINSCVGTSTLNKEYLTTSSTCEPLIEIQFTRFDLRAPTLKIIQFKIQSGAFSWQRDVMWSLINRSISVSTKINLQHQHSSSNNDNTTHLSTYGTAQMIGDNKSVFYSAILNPIGHFDVFILWTRKKNRIKRGPKTWIVYFFWNIQTIYRDFVPTLEN